MMNPRLKMSHDGAARVQYFQPRVTIFHCRMNNYKLLRRLVETPSRDVEHYRILNVSAVDPRRHYNVTPGDSEVVT